MKSTYLGSFKDLPRDGDPRGTYRMSLDALPRWSGLIKPSRQSRATLEISRGINVVGVEAGARYKWRFWGCLLQDYFLFDTAPEDQLTLLPT